MLVLFVFTTSVLNNLVLNFNISMPLHMIFRSVSLLVFVIRNNSFSNQTKISYNGTRVYVPPWASTCDGIEVSPPYERSLGPA